MAEELGPLLVGGRTRRAEPRALCIGADRQVEWQELQGLSLLALGGQRGWAFAATRQQQSLGLLQQSGRRRRTSRPFPERVVRVSCQLRRRHVCGQVPRVHCVKAVTRALGSGLRHPRLRSALARWVPYIVVAQVELFQG